MRKSLQKRLAILAVLMISAVGLMLTTPVSQLEASACEQYAYCIEYTVWNEYTCRCECPNQECCEFYYPFVPYGCPIG